MGKLLFWIVLVVAAWVVVRVLIAKGRDVSGPAAGGRDAVPDQPPATRGDNPEAMRQCAHCGVWFPASESVVSADGRPYCGRAHHDAAGHAGSE